MSGVTVRPVVTPHDLDTWIRCPRQHTFPHTTYASTTSARSTWTGCSASHTAS
jgi:hypothetical protein